MSTYHGSVVAFDREVGLGTLRDDTGGEWPFHCIEIADGTRDIEVGVAVTFGLVAKLGRYEAAQVTRAEP